MDVIRQIGLGLRQTKKDSKYAIDRTARHFPIIERVSDYLTGPSAAVPAGNLFAQEFKTYHHDDEARLSLNFGPDVVSVPVPCNTCGCDCGITDTFTRTVATGWGTSDSGIEWVPYIYDNLGTTTRGVDGSRAWYSSSQSTKMSSLYLPTTPNPQDWTTVVSISRLPTGSPDGPFIFILGENSSAPIIYFWIGPRYPHTLSSLQLVEQSYVDTKGNGYAGYPTITANTDYSIRWYRDDLISKVRLWATASTEPSDWLIEIPSGATPTTPTTHQSLIAISLQSTSTTLTTGYVNDVNIVGVDRCTESRFDNFDRTVPAEWGTSSDGHLWVTNLGSYNGGTILDTASVGSGVGTVVVHGGSTVLSIGDATAPWAGDTFTMTARFSIASAPTDVLTTSTLAFHPGSTLSGAYIQMAFTAGPPITGVPKSYIECGNGDATFIPPSFWTDGGTYTLTLAVSGLSETATIVGAGGTYSATGNRPFASNGNFSVHPSWYTSGFQTFTFDYIDFDYDGKPCY